MCSSSSHPTMFSSSNTFDLTYSQLSFFSGLQNSGLPWVEPKKTLSLDLSSLTDSISGVFGVSIQFFFHYSFCNEHKKII